jgi:hypothetical protein
MTAREDAAERRAALDDAEQKTLTRLLGKAQQGDDKAIAELRPILDKSGLWDYLGDLSRRVQVRWLEAMTLSNTLIREAYERRTADMRAELLAAGDSPLERLLTDRIIMCVCQPGMAHFDAREWPTFSIVLTAMEAACRLVA